MKALSRILLALLLVTILIGSADAQRKGRKLTPGAYIESAQIAIVSGDTTRYKDAILMLDSLLINYGPHPEAYFWLNQLQIDYIEKSPGLETKRPYVEKLALYRDSIRYACTSESVDKKFKKKCEDYSAQSDSSVAKYWRIFYSAGADQYKAIEEAVKEMATQEDSASKAFYQAKIDANADSALANMNLCITLDSSDERAYMLAGAVMDQKKDYAASNEWLGRGLAHAKDSSTVLLQVAYNQVQQNKYCEAIPYFKEYLRHQPSDTGTLINLTICYNNCKMYDSAASVHRQILTLDPNHPDALSGLGRYYNQLGLFANDSSSAAREKNNEAASKKWSDVRSQMFDSSRSYFKKAFEADPANTLAAEEFGVISLLSSDYKAAVEVFTKLTELEPDKSSHWLSLGDSHFYLKDFAKAAEAYEKVVALEPDNRQIWERLYDIYQSGEVKNPTRAAEAKKHLQ